MTATIHRFTHADRNQSMTHTVNYKGVPMPRGNAFMYDHCEKHGAKVSVASCIRTVDVINAFNKQFGTDLHAQAYLIEMHRRDPANYAAANSVDTTSHCWFSDGSACYRSAKGEHIASGGKLPWYMIGTDIDDIGKVENNSHLLYVAHQLGYPLLAPYNAGSERHHLILASSPIKVLEHWNVIAKERAS